MLFLHGICNFRQRRASENDQKKSAEMPLACAQKLSSAQSIIALILFREMDLQYRCQFHVKSLRGLKVATGLEQ